MHRPLYSKLRDLRDGKTIDFEGVELKMVDDKRGGADLKPGDLYYACRNTEQLLTVHMVNFDGGWVIPVESAYSFDFGECVGVTLA